MPIIRVSKRDRYVVIDRQAVDDPRLSYRAVGLLVFLLSKPDDWRVNSDNLADMKSEGRDAVRTALKELQTAGYAVLERTQTDGRWASSWVVYEDPQPTEDGIPGVGSPGPGNPTVGSPGVGSPGPRGKTQTEDLEETGPVPGPDDDQGGKVLPMRKLNPAEQIAQEELADLLPKLRRGSGIDLTAEIVQVFRRSWTRAAEDPNLNPQVAGQAVLSAYWYALLGTDPDPKTRGLIGKLVRNFQAAAITGFAAAMGRNLEGDWFAYAWRVCQNQVEEHEAQKERGSP